MKTKILFFAVSALFATACTSNNRQSKEEILTKSSDVAPLLVRGKLVIGHEVSSFTADGDTIDYWIHDKTNQLDSLYQEVTKESTSPYTPVHAELKVYDRGKATDGFAADYDGTYEVVDIIKISPIKE